MNTIATVHEDGTLTLPNPGNLSRGSHPVVVVLDELPAQEVEATGSAATARNSPWAKMAEFRRKLGVPTPAKNTVVEMREEVRSLHARMVAAARSLELPLVPNSEPSGSRA